ncbi:MAG: tRNA lysidine(34) synthetase TilS [Shinella sp.]|nr:tRNA lysidine(34) synthetase TilS [Shinella sp.]
MSPAEPIAVARAGENAVVDAAGRFLKSFQNPVRLLVAVSGGSDSTGLLLAFAAALRTGRHPGFSLLASTVDHGLRRESANEAAAVAALCERNGIRHITRRWEGEKPASGLQAAAREKRYELLADVAREEHAAAILTAHTAEDQRETIAMRAARVEEGIGLSGMAPAVLFDQSVWVMRPFLGLQRADIRSFLAAEKEGWIDDPSNADEAFERVRIRNLPIGPSHSGERAGRERSRLSAQAADVLRRCVTLTAGAVAVIAARDIALLRGDPAGWRALMSLTAVLGGRRYPPDRSAAARIGAFLESGKLSRITAGRVVFDRRREGLYLYREHRGVAAVTVEPGGTALWDGRYEIRNLSAARMTVSAAGAGEASLLDGDMPGLPSGVAARAQKAFPAVSGRAEASHERETANMTAEHRLAPFDRFLPVFDLALANAMAELFGRHAYPAPPNA